MITSPYSNTGEWQSTHEFQSHVLARFVGVDVLSDVSVSVKGTDKLGDGHV